MSDWDTSKEAFIQWKGTDVCMDLLCPKCGYHNHYDGYFAYTVQCAKCKTYYAMNQFVQFTETQWEPGTALLTCEYEPAGDADQPNGDL